ncbi:MAG: NAD(P)-dependent oxidoreductase [Bacteroidota bacterium]|jgi:D-3-phosphoglycerate dehydrogenase
MKKILANDGIDALGKKILQEAGFTVITDKVAQENLADYINSNSIEVLTVRSATKVRKDIIDNCANLKLVVRGGVGIDNIDAEYAKEKGLKVANTPAASSDSVAELVIANMFSMCRFLYDSNRKMPISGAVDFNELKKKYSGGKELKGKTLGIIGIGRIGQAVASRAVGLGMKVVAYDPFVENTTIKIELDGAGLINIPLKTISLDEVLATSDYITVHVPGGSIIDKAEIAQMKNGVCLINTSRGGVINEVALIEGLNSGKIAHAALDVFENEPTPKTELLSHPKISLTPHIGAATDEAQERIGLELATIIVSFFKE